MKSSYVALALLVGMSNAAIAQQPATDSKPAVQRVAQAESPGGASVGAGGAVAPAAAAIPVAGLVVAGVIVVGVAVASNNSSTTTHH